MSAEPEDGKAGDAAAIAKFFIIVGIAGNGLGLIASGSLDILAVGVGLAIAAVVIASAYAVRHIRAAKAARVV
jgi:hypothetical protein